MTKNSPVSQPGSHTYEIVDGKKIIDDYKMQHPDKAHLVPEGADKQLDFILYDSGGWGDKNVKIEWKYIAIPPR